MCSQLTSIRHYSSDIDFPAPMTVARANEERLRATGRVINRTLNVGDMVLLLDWRV
jgi:hypothetical protein